MEDRLAVLAKRVDLQQKSIDNLLELLELFDKRLNIQAEKIDAVKRLVDANTGMISSNNDTISKIFEILSRD